MQGKHSRRLYNVDVLWNSRLHCPGDIARAWIRCLCGLVWLFLAHRILFLILIFIPTGGLSECSCTKWWLANHHSKRRMKTTCSSRFCTTTLSTQFGSPKKLWPFSKGFVQCSFWDSVNLFVFAWTVSYQKSFQTFGLWSTFGRECHQKSSILQGYWLEGIGNEECSNAVQTQNSKEPLFINLVVFFLHSLFSLVYRKPNVMSPILTKISPKKKLFSHQPNTKPWNKSGLIKKNLMDSRSPIHISIHPDLKYRTSSKCNLIRSLPHACLLSPEPNNQNFCIKPKIGYNEFSYATAIQSEPKGCVSSIFPPIKAFPSFFFVFNLP